MSANIPNPMEWLGDLHKDGEYGDYGTLTHTTVAVMISDYCALALAAKDAEIERLQEAVRKIRDLPPDAIIVDAWGIIDANPLARAAVEGASHDTA